ncbi:hypothetical protein AKJ45_00065 [candidate division MSBL1 archaeon SCGC-AAA261F19]|uniref:Uncharacterized protein n=2 Tax=candidate division MSBL1 TaxID=215777 RepID=A0A133VBU5_9EURY|nr:hypothetical protein AKJ43_00870 [candidate division MSBL1 archaeon SCGC-AAA261D19]KXB03887.1 hypothetical protein AKJ45_00065 [candidate division MSBL1 archaeon SCGC-AAA261F19]
MTQFSVIGVVGLPASGKTSVVKAMVDLGASRIRMGSIIWKEAKRRGLKINEKNVGKIANELRNRGGLDVIAKRCIPIARGEGRESKVVVIDGIRGSQEVKAFKEAFDDYFYLVSVDASEKTRFSRIKARGRKDDSSDWEAFQRKNRRELKWGLEEAMKLADFSIVNEGTLEDLRAQATEIFEKVVG